MEKLFPDFRGVTIRSRIWAPVGSAALEGAGGGGDADAEGGDATPAPAAVV